MSPPGTLSPVQRLLLLSGLVLAWPAAINQTPVYFSDTTAYVRGADALVVKLTGHTTIWSDRAATLAHPAASATQATPPPNIILGRSLFYGILLYLGAIAGTMAIPVIVQSLLAGAVLIGALRHVVDPTDARRFAAATIATFAVATLTSLPYFVSFLMPDLFAGLAIVAATVLISRWRRETAAWRVFWVAILGYAALVHSSHVLLIVGLGVLGLALAAVRFAGIGALAPALVIVAAMSGPVADKLVAIGIETTLGRTPIRPPFLAMRLVADGPGRAWLAEHCPRPDIALCRYAGRAPVSTDVMLWSADPRIGVFTAAPPALQARLAREQFAFVRAVVTDHPAWVATTAMRGALRQAGLIGLEDFRVPLLADPGVPRRLPPTIRTAIAGSPAERGALPTLPYRLMIWPLVAGGLLALMLLVRRDRNWLSPALLLVSGVAGNAAICGALSNQSQRYQDRVIWVLALPVAALPVLIRRRWTVSGRPAP